MRTHFETKIVLKNLFIIIHIVIIIVFISGKIMYERNPCRFNKENINYNKISSLDTTLDTIFRKKINTLKTVESDIGSVDKIFDSNTATLFRSKNINPLVIEIEFDDSCTFSKAKIITSHGQSYKLLLEMASNYNDLCKKSGDWIQFKDNTSGQKNIPYYTNSIELSKINFRVKILRLTIEKSGANDDGYVHLNEWEMLQ